MNFGFCLYHFLFPSAITQSQNQFLSRRSRNLRVKRAVDFFLPDKAFPASRFIVQIAASPFRPPVYLQLAVFQGHDAQQLSLIVPSAAAQTASLRAMTSLQSRSGPFLLFAVA
jgi:hypothetical protein